MQTLADYQATPDEPPWYQLIEGALLQEPNPSFRHQDLLGELHCAFRNYLADHPIGTTVLAPFAVYLDKFNVFQPDLLMVLAERRAIVTSRGVMGAPDFVIEILSPSNRRYDLGPKRRGYARAGVKRLWIVDPEASSVADYDLPRAPEAPIQVWAPPKGGTLTCPLLPGFALAWGRLFR